MSSLDLDNLSSGKGLYDENFPVGSFLISGSLRPFVHDFYGFVRCVDDIADHGVLSSDEKLSLLESQERALMGSLGYEGDGFSSARRLHVRLLEMPHLLCHARDMLVAFRQDATKNRYEDWDDLVHYCSYSANPVGRFLLDLHGESDGCYAYADSLCTALQILNHLQDCGSDYVDLDRVYLPESFFRCFGGDVSDLGLSFVTPSLRSVLDMCLDGVDVFLDTSRRLPTCLLSRRLGLESAVIHSMACRLSVLLRRGDPLASSVSLYRSDFLLRSFIGILAFFTGRY